MFRAVSRPSRSVQPTTLFSRGYHEHANIAQYMRGAALSKVLEHLDDPEDMKHDAFIKHALDMSMKHALASDLLKKCCEKQSVNPEHYKVTGILKLIDAHRAGGLEKPEVYEAYDRYLSQYKLNA